MRISFPLSTTTAFAALFIVGCAPTIRVATPDPVKIDVAMKVDVHTEESAKKINEDASSTRVAEDRRARMAEVQNLKNDRVAGEDRDGYLVIRQAPTDPKYADYAKRIVQEENNDRVLLYMRSAREQGKPLELAQREFAKLWRERAFPGELVQQDDGSWTTVK